MISSSSRLSFFAALVALPCLAFAAGCSSSNDSTSSAKVAALSFDSTACSLDAVGQTKQFHVTAHAPDGTVNDVTESAQWNSADTNKVTVVKGLVTAVQTGITDVSVTYEGATNSVSCKVL